MAVLSIVTFSAVVSTALAGSISLPIHKENVNTTHNRGNRLIQEIAEDKSTVNEPISWDIQAYFATIYVGSNRQKATPMIDTGSSDLWLMTPQNQFHNTLNGLEFIFDPSESTTFQNLSKPFFIGYVDTTVAMGHLGMDDVQIGDVTVKDLDFGVAEFSNDSLSILGVSFIGEEGEAGQYTYPNLPTMLKRQGYIDHLAYSLYLNDLQSGEGQILFGGVDTAKYTGQMGLVPVIESQGMPSLAVVLSGINVHLGDNSCPLVDGPLGVLLDSGTTYSILFPDIVESIANAMGYEYDSGGDAYIGSCSKNFGFDSFELDFSGVKLQSTPESLIGPWYYDNGQQMRTDDGSLMCWLRLQTTNVPEDLILGDVFLRSFYIAYDLENKQIGLAQTKFDANSESNIEDIVSEIPSVTTAPGYSNTQFGTSYQTHTDYDSCLSNPWSLDSFWPPW